MGMVNTMRIVALTADYDVGMFDCGDDDLNRFLKDDAKPAQQLRIANTYLLVDGEHTVAYFCLLNDKVSKDEVIGSRWKKLKAGFPKGKQFRSYPTVKIGRFAVSNDYRGLHVGTFLLQKIKLMLSKQRAHSAFRYITVDAYLSAVSFYEKNGFVHLTKRDEDEHTRLMFYDMMEVE
jgi:predicted GNAT family N-acyltransferase